MGDNFLQGRLARYTRGVVGNGKSVDLSDRAPILDLVLPPHVNVLTE